MTSPLHQRVAAVIDRLFGLPADALSDDVTLQDGLELDSLSVVELQVALEDEFDIRLAREQSEPVETFGQLVAAVAAALSVADADDRDDLRTGKAS